MTPPPFSTQARKAATSSSEKVHHGPLFESSASPARMITLYLARSSGVSVVRLLMLSTSAVPALLLLSQFCKAASGSPPGFAPHLPGLPMTASLKGGHMQASPPSQPTVSPSLASEVNLPASLPPAPVPWKIGLPPVPSAPPVPADTSSV